MAEPLAEAQNISCRVVASFEPLDDGKEWSFYIVNDGRVPLDCVKLLTFGHEWGDFGHSKHPDAQVSDVAPGANACIWRDNDDEFRMWLKLLVTVGASEAELLAEFPMLYRSKGNLPLVPGLQKPGFAVRPVPSEKSAT